jgi:hypothetical protein
MIVFDDEILSLSLPSDLEMVEYLQTQNEGNLYFYMIHIRQLNTEKTVSVWKAPNILVLQLNPFEEINEVGRKNTAKV